MADTKHPLAILAESIVDKIKLGTYPAGLPLAGPNGTPWIEVTKWQSWDRADTSQYREHGRGGVGSGKRV